MRIDAAGMGAATVGRRWACCAERLFDGDEVRPGWATIIEGDKIAAVVRAAELPPGMPMLSVPGGTVLPGLIDVHVHFGRWQGPLYLAYGVTTVRDVGNDAAWILERRAEAHRHPWPHLVCVGPMLDGPQPYWGFCRACPDESAACRAVAETAALGVDGIKLYPGLPTTWLPSIVAEVRKTGLPSMMHCADMMASCAAGVEECFHLDGLLSAVWPGRPPGWLEVWGHKDFPQDTSRLDATADRTAELRSIVTPTLFYWDFARRIRSPMALPQESSAIPPRNLEWLRSLRGHEVDPAAAGTWDRATRRVQEFVARLVERDVPLLPGTDEPWGVLPPGLSLWRELTLLAECGLSPIAALRAATSQAAARLRMPNRGRLRPGYAADLVLVIGDPTVTMPDRPEISAVVRDGVVYSPDELHRQSVTYAATLDGEPMGIAFRKAADR